MGRQASGQRGPTIITLLKQLLKPNAPFGQSNRRYYPTFAHRDNFSGVTTFAHPAAVIVHPSPNCSGNALGITTRRSVESKETNISTFQRFIKICSWSWRGSNPRPNREPMRFLHAYSGLHFRALSRPGPPNNALSPKISPCRRSAT